MYIGTRTGYYKRCATRVSWARESGDYPPPHHIRGMFDICRVCFGGEVVSERSYEGVGLNLSACCCCGNAGVAGCSPPAPTTVFVTGIHDALSNDTFATASKRVSSREFPNKAASAALQKRESKKKKKQQQLAHHTSPKYPFYNKLIHFAFCSRNSFSSFLFILLFLYLFRFFFFVL